MSRKQWQEVAVCLVIIAVSALVFVESLKLPPGNYDPLGGGTMPRIICSIIIVLTLTAILQTVLPVLAGRSKNARGGEDTHSLRPLLAVGLFGLLVLYVFSVQLRLPFAPSTVLFIFLSTMLLARFSRKIIPGALAVSIGAGFSLSYLFTSVFKVDLP